MEGAGWREAAAWGGGVAAAYWGGPMGLVVADTAGLANHHRGQLHPHREPGKELVPHPNLVERFHETDHM